MKVPATVGVPVNDIELDAQLAVTPVGKPVATPIPVAPVVVCVNAGDIAVSIHIVRVTLLEVVLLGATVKL